MRDVRTWGHHRTLAQDSKRFLKAIWGEYLYIGVVKWRWRSETLSLMWESKLEDVIFFCLGFLCSTKEVTLTNCAGFIWLQLHVCPRGCSNQHQRKTLLYGGGDQQACCYCPRYWLYVGFCLQGIVHWLLWPYYLTPKMDMVSYFDPGNFFPSLYDTGFIFCA